MFKTRAYAKVNLALNVVGKREDGYHEMEMIMVPISLYDQVQVSIADTMSFECNRPYIRWNESNTMYKAIEVLREHFHFKENFAIRLYKMIPTQAGLAGGSSDAAAMLKAVVKLLHLDVDATLMNEFAGKVGADVPFCMQSQCCLVNGFGERLEPFNLNTKFHLLLVKPHEGVSTKLAFGQLDLATAAHPDCLKMKEALEQDNYPGFLDELGNTLEQSAFKIVPKIEKIKQQLLDLGFDGALMSGSGSTVFGVTRNEQLCDEAEAKLRKAGYFCVKTEILNSSPRK